MSGRGVRARSCGAARQYREGCHPSVVRSVRGAGMVEVMVALLLFSTVFTALALTQLAGKRMGGEALQHSRATELAQDMLERISANSGVAAVYTAEKLGRPQSALPVPARNCSQVVCTPGQMAEHDLWQWEAQLMGLAERRGSVPVGGLPGGRSCIRFAAGTVTVAISWLGQSGSAESTLSDCAADETGLYDLGGEPEGNNLRRRQVVLSRYVGAAA